jgi:homoserine dehydrogenase
MNGTTNFMLTAMEEDLSLTFKDNLKVAQDLG